jgi:hypothetical protein
LANLDRHMVETDRARLPCFGHGTLLIWLSPMWCGGGLPAINAFAAFELDQSMNQNYIAADGPIRDPIPT